MDMESIKSTIFLRAFGLLKVPMLAFASPKVLEASDAKCILKIPLGYRTKNHLGAMYFGALNIGAEACVGLMAVKKIKDSGKKIDFLFKDYKVTFLKRCEGDVHFVCEEISLVVDTIQESLRSKDRINKLIKAYAVVPSVNPKERVAEFELTLSVKNRS